MKSLLRVKVITILCLIVFPVSAALGAIPAEPTNLTGTVTESVGSPRQITLDWVDNSLDETSFRIEQSLDGVTFTLLGTVSPDVTSYVDTTVTGDILYYYQVLAENADGTSGPSNQISMYTQDTVAPPVPALTWPPNGDRLDTNGVRYEWDTVSDMSGVTYRIIVDDMDHGITLHDVSGITGKDITLQVYDAYYEWWVIAEDGAGNVSAASEVSRCQVSDSDNPAPDTTVTAPNGGEVLESGSSFAITWYALDQDFTSTPDLKIQILFSPNNGNSWEQVTSADENLGAYDWTVPNVSCDETCLIRVTTENMAGMLGSDDSDFAFSIVSSSSNSDGSPAPVINNAPSAPVLVFPANGQTGLNTDIAPLWKKSQDPDDDEVTYSVSYCTDQNFINCPPVTVANVGPPKAFDGYAGLPNAGLLNAGLPGLLLLGTIFAVPQSRRKKFMLLMISLIVIGGGVVGCGGDGDGGLNLVPLVPDELSQQISGLEAATTYYWKVGADDGKGGTSESAVWSFTTQ